MIVPSGSTWNEIDLSASSSIYTKIGISCISMPVTCVNRVYYNSVAMKTWQLAGNSYGGEISEILENSMLHRFFSSEPTN